MSNSQIAVPSFAKDMKLFPLKPKTKEPLVSWQTDTVYDLNDYPTATSYAIDCKRSGIVVIDCDNKHGVNGIASFTELASNHDDLNTVIVETPNMGLHYYFKAPEGVEIRNSAGTALGPGVDVRGVGGYIVGPGSVVATEAEPGEDGAAPLGVYELYDEDTEIAELPEWLLSILVNHEESKSKAKKSASTKTKKNDKIITSHKSSERAGGMTEAETLIDRRNALEWAKVKMSLAVVGTRETTLNLLSYGLGQRRVDRKIAEELIDVAIATGLPPKEAAFKFNHGYTDGLEADETSFEMMQKQYNSKTNSSFVDDPMDSGYYTHLALSHNFYLNNKDKYIYWDKNGTWYAYRDEEGYWEAVSDTFISEKVDEFMEALVQALRKDYPNAPAHIYKMQERLWLKSYVDAVAAFVKKRYLVTDEDIFDNDPTLLNCKNGVVDMKTKAILEHDRSYYFTRYIPVNYKEGPTDKMCEAILSSIHPDELDYLQLILGQSLTGYQPQYQAAYFLHGRGSNGKSTLIDLALRTSGTYGKLQAPNVLAEEKQGGDKYALADFEHLRSCFIEELPDSKNLNAGALKRIVGTQLINARQIYGRNRTFENKSTIFISCNKLPMVTETDDGTWRRVLVIHFPYSYKKSQGECKTKWDRVGDPRVLHAAQKKVSTAEAFLTWRVEGAHRWLKNPGAEYTVPQRILDNTDHWRDNNDLLRSWFKSELEVDTKSAITLEDLRLSFNAYLVARGNAPISQRFFLDLFLNHDVYHSNPVGYRRNTSIPVAMTRSIWFDKSDPNYQPKTSFVSTNFVVGLKFSS